jgi:hypothetical protein
MRYFEIEAREKFVVRTTYFVAAESREAAESLVRGGKVPYEGHSIEEGGEEFLSVESVEEHDPDEIDPAVFDSGSR